MKLNSGQSWTGLGEPKLGLAARTRRVADFSSGSGSRGISICQTLIQRGILVGKEIKIRGQGLVKYPKIHTGELIEVEERGLVSSKVSSKF